MRSITTTGADVVRDVEKLFPPDLEYENVEIIRCLNVGECERGGTHHEDTCPMFSDESHAPDREL